MAWASLKLPWCGNCYTEPFGSRLLRRLLRKPMNLKEVPAEAVPSRSLQKHCRIFGSLHKFQVVHYIESTRVMPKSESQVVRQHGRQKAAKLWQISAGILFFSLSGEKSPRDLIKDPPDILQCMNQISSLLRL